MSAKLQTDFLEVLSARFRGAQLFELRISWDGRLELYIGKASNDSLRMLFWKGIYLGILRSFTLNISRRCRNEFCRHLGRLNIIASRAYGGFTRACTNTKLNNVACGHACAILLVFLAESVLRNDIFWGLATS